MENHIFLNRYRLSLGRNGLPVELHRSPGGITYRGHQIDSGREVAIEIVPWISPEPAATEKKARAAAAAGQINHLNIPALYDFGIEDEQLVFVSDYFEGYTAESWVAARGPLPVGAVLCIALQVVSALGAANFHRIHHPAINPTNIIFVPGQTAQGDWPAIKVLGWLVPNVAAEEGSSDRADAAARFASPEQLRGGEVDFASAIFSLGCTIWFLLTGTPPAVPGAMGVRGRIEKLRGVPKIVRHLLGRMLRVNPAERPQDPVVLQAYLQTCLARVERREAMSKRLGVPLLARVPARAMRKVRHWPTKPLALAALLLLCATLAAVALPRLLRSRRIASKPAAGETAMSPAQTPVTFLSSNRGEAWPNELATAPAKRPEEFVAAEPEQSAPAAAFSEVADTQPQPAPAETIAPVRQTESTALAMNEGDKIPAIVPSDEVAQPPKAPGSEPRLASEETAPALPPPAEGPDELVAAAPVQTAPTTTSPELTAESPHLSPGQTAEPVMQTESPALASTEPTETPASAPPDNVSQPAGNTDPEPRLVAEQSAPPTPKPTPSAGNPELAAQSSSRKRSKTRSVASRRKSHIRSHKKTRVAKADVRRGRKIPALHVGGNRAELVGTTKDGHWILSVASGKHIIVPPPPGY